MTSRHARNTRTSSRRRRRSRSPGLGPPPQRSGSGRRTGVRRSRYHDDPHLVPPHAVAWRAAERPEHQQSARRRGWIRGGRPWLSEVDSRDGVPGPVSRQRITLDNVLSSGHWALCCAGDARCIRTTRHLAERAACVARLECRPCARLARWWLAGRTGLLAAATTARGQVALPDTDALPPGRTGNFATVPTVRASATAEPGSPRTAIRAPTGSLPSRRSTRSTDAGEASGVPARPVMTVYHGSEGPMFVFSKLLIWYFQRSQVIDLTDFSAAEAVGYEPQAGAALALLRLAQLHEHAAEALRCRNATCVPCAPGREDSSMSRAPAGLARAKCAAGSLTSRLTWCKPGPRVSRNLATVWSALARLQQLERHRAEVHEHHTQCAVVQQLFIATPRARARSTSVCTRRRRRRGPRSPRGRGP